MACWHADDTTAMQIISTGNVGLNNKKGTLAAIDHIWGMLKEDVLEAQFSVFDVVSEYRKRRQSIVQTADQYLYVYKAVLDLVKNILQGIDPLTAGAPGGQKYDVVRAVLHSTHA